MNGRERMPRTTDMPPVDSYTTPQEVMTEKERVDAEIANIKAQLDAAIGLTKETGEYADSVWFAKAKAAARFYGQRSQALQRRMGEFRRQRAVTTPDIEARRRFVFCRLVKERVGELEYAVLWRQAEEEAAREATT